MTPDEKIRVIWRLAEAATDFPDTQVVMLDAIRGVLGPEPSTKPANPSEPTLSELLLLRNKQKIEAIRAYRDRNRASLKEAKEAIEDAGVRLGLTFSHLGHHEYADEREVRLRRTAEVIANGSSDASSEPTNGDAYPDDGW